MAVDIAFYKQKQWDDSAELIRNDSKMATTRLSQTMFGLESTMSSQSVKFLIRANDSWG